MTATLPEILVSQAVASGAFDADDADVRNNLGLLGLLEVESKDRASRLCLSLEPVDVEHPTRWTLEVEMEHVKERKAIRIKLGAINYSGNQPGNYLRKLLANGELLRFLKETSSQAV